MFCTEMMKTVILAAGRGSRLGKFTEDKPKSLVEVGGKPIIEHMFDSLKEVGLTDIIMVVGYRHEKFEYLRECYPDVSLAFIENSVYSKTNTAYSLWLVREHIRDGFFLLNGDVIFHPAIMWGLRNSPESDAIVVERKDVDEEEVKVKIVDNTVKKISKRVPLDEADAEFVGILKFSAFSASKYLDLLDHAISLDKKYNMYFDDVIEDLAQDVHVHTMDIGEFPCMEIDTEDDLNRARSSIWPKITGSLCK